MCPAKSKRFFPSEQMGPHAAPISPVHFHLPARVAAFIPAAAAKIFIRILTIETWVDSHAWERATSPAAPDRRIGRTDGPDCASPGYFAKKSSKI